MGRKLSVRMWHVRRTIEKSGLFDETYYLKQTSADLQNLDPITHYLRYGAEAGLAPNPLFDSAWYLHTHADVATAGYNPLYHYIRYGAAELRDPGPLFATDTYLHLYPHVRRSGINPLLDYLRHGFITPYPDAEKLVIFHLTHWKAGSQWVKTVLAEAQSQRVVGRKADMSILSHDPIVEGGWYSPVYMTRPNFEHAIDPTLNKRVFVVIRDLRDTLISWYFSLKVSHRPNIPGILPVREQLLELDLEDGLKLLIEDELAFIANIQMSWIDSGEPVFRYEDLLADGFNTFKQIFAHCALHVPDRKCQEIVQKHSFEGQTGRKPGQEVITSHFRKAIVGDWKNYFTDSVKALFKEKFGQVLIDTGYERDYDW